ncbi:Rhomboid family protein [Pseudoxanthomonas suwonensis 11-1]|uniref:Rhomboid family protein n=1 Tax=Pseudoxanthomonas suwonensis (strain 11-1) TaxID=743721 RepID=E6WSJ6_PSEUU|nr:rhomboid family intramembrane serine protease [Pseudoxanthomonas suwonensis]ADV27210.1 Rhomboid family protein [Pseudoxanthomonas suwonensis 11-1]
MLQPVTLALIAITALVSWRAFSDRRLLDRMILWPPAVARQREYWRLLTHGFLHADFPHLLFNMFTLFFFGGLIERLMTGITGSRLTFLLFYLSAIVVAILPSYLKNIGNPRYFSLGASGAVSAVLFAFIMVKPWSLILVFFVPMPAIVYAVFYVGYSIWMDRRGGGNINHSAHLAGAAYGVLFMVAMAPEVLELFWQQLLNPRFG